MLEYLRRLGGKVRAWFFTHPHDDHVGCFISLLEENDDITVDEVYYNFPAEEFSVGFEPNQGSMTTAELYRRFALAIKDNNINAVCVKTFDEYSFGDLCVSVLHTPNENVTEDPVNNSSVAFRFDICGKRILFLGDLGVAGGREMLEQIPRDLIKADYVQMSHHGQNGVEKCFYETVSPKYAMWCTPEWMWNNRAGRDGGYNTGKTKTLIVRGWMEEIGVEHNYVVYEETQVIEL
jgi:beta-lactamase superfamily II metal-dependent hydrolase